MTASEGRLEGGLLQGMPELDRQPVHWAGSRIRLASLCFSFIYPTEMLKNADTGLAVVVIPTDGSAHSAEPMSSR